MLLSFLLDTTSSFSIMKKFFLLFVTGILSPLVYSQDYQTQFNELFQKGNTLSQRLVLENWERDDPKNAELYTCYFNYYINHSKRELLALTNEEPDEESLVISDESNNPVGYLGSDIYYDKIEFERGIDKINKGIELYPNRLDMRFGKIYAFGLTEDWRRFTDEIIVTINYSIVNDNNWTWTNNEEVNSDANDFLLSIQDYQLQLYNTGDDDLLLNMREIALAVLKHYPDHIESLSNLSITYMVLGENDKAIEYLLKAEKLNPRDYIILGNIAEAYKRKGDTNMAAEYYQKILQYGNEKAREYANNQLNALMNN